MGILTNLSAGSGPLTSKFWIIGDSYGDSEKLADAPFVGKSGMDLRKKLKVAGIDERHIHFDNVVNFQPPKNNFSWFSSDSEGREILGLGVRELRERIKEFKPHLVFCVGLPPLTHVMQKGSPLKKWRGHVFWNEELGVKCMCSYHPSSYIKQRFVKKDTKTDEHPGQFEALFYFDLEKAYRESIFAESVFSNFESLVSPTFEELESELVEILKNGERLSYDIETLGKRYNFMDCIGFASTRKRGLCIPFAIPMGGGFPPQEFWKLESERARIFELVKRLLESDIPKYAQNSQFDSLILGEYYGISVRNLVWDTYVAAHCIYCDLPKDFGTLLSLYTNLPYQKYLIATGSVLDRWEYNVADAVGNLHIADGQLEQLKEAGTLEHFRKISMPLLPALVEMQRAGVLVNTKLQAGARKLEGAKMQRLLVAFDKICPQINTAKNFPHKFNPGSPKQKQKLFFQILKTKPTYKKGKLSMDADSMARIMEKDHRPFVTTIAETCIEYRRAQDMFGKLSTPLRNGRLHTAYNAAGTDTGRLNSKESAFGVGTNLQNLSKGIQRRMLIPDPGEEFCYVDLWAAEAFLTFLDAGESEALVFLSAGNKIHDWLLQEIVVKFPESCLKAWGYKKGMDSKSKEHAKAYHKSKQLIHAMNYNVAAPKMCMESGLPINVTEWILAMYHATYPGIRRRLARIEIEIKTTRSLTSFLGRKRIFLAPYSQGVLNSAYAWPSQSTIGELTNRALAKIYNLGVVSKQSEDSFWMFPALNTHDGLAIRVHKGTRDVVKRNVANAFNVPMKTHGLSVTIPIELGWAQNFNDVEDEEVVWYKTPDSEA